MQTKQEVEIYHEMKLAFKKGLIFRFLPNISCYEFSSCKREITILIANMWWACSLGAQSCLVIACSLEDNMFTML